MGQLFGVNIETFIERQFDSPEDNVAVEYLKRRRWKMPKESALCLEEMKDRAFTIKNGESGELIEELKNSIKGNTIHHRFVVDTYTGIPEHNYFSNKI